MAETRRTARPASLALSGYHDCVTHLFKRGHEFIETDVVYAVKEPLIVEFVKHPPGKASTGEVLSMPFYELRYDFVLQRKAAAE
jgi:hydroxyquinol 1,2-dioxygenase